MSSYNHKYRDLKVWKSAIALATVVYTQTRLFPKEELFGLSQQMRRAVVSISSNIAEGSRRRSRKEFVQFLHIAIGSSAELATQIIIARNVGMLTEEDFSHLEIAIDDIEKMLAALIKSVEISESKPLKTHNSQLEST